jgi:hypothetical protein
MIPKNKPEHDYSSGINLKIITKAGEVKLENVIEYVCGKLYFYINMGLHNDVKFIDRDIIHKVIRYNDVTEWPINLKQFKN